VYEVLRNKRRKKKEEEQDYIKLQTMRPVKYAGETVPYPTKDHSGADTTLW
jgi:hypothetical protein